MLGVSLRNHKRNEDIKKNEGRRCNMKIYSNEVELSPGVEANSLRKKSYYKDFIAHTYQVFTFLQDFKSNVRVSSNGANDNEILIMLKKFWWILNGSKTYSNAND